jgi:hypothetical protein
LPVLRPGQRKGKTKWHLCSYQLLGNVLVEAFQSGSLSGRPQTARRRLAMTRQAWAKYQCQSHERIVKETADDSPSPWESIDTLLKTKHHRVCE